MQWGDEDGQVILNTLLIIHYLFIQNDKELEQLEHEINPLLGDDPLAALSFLLRKCVEKMILVPNVRTILCFMYSKLLCLFLSFQSRPFHFPVNSKKLPDYHIIIAKPMDLETLRKVQHIVFH